MRRRRPALFTCLAAVLAMVAGFASRPAAAQCADPNPCNTAGLANWVGDLNNDLAVNAADATVYAGEPASVPTSGMPPSSDGN